VERPLDGPTLVECRSHETRAELLKLEGVLHRPYIPPRLPKP
jgi:hypothetical protein